MPKAQVACPQCHQPTLVEIQQIFDMNQDPLAKQKLLSGAVNTIHCPICGYSGMVGTPIVYHDPEKELFLTFFPPESGVPLNEQEKQLGRLINRVIDGLPPEKRKAYVLQPKSMFTYQTLIETILEADGITKEMLEEQQKKLQLIQQLLSSPETDLETIIEQEKDHFDVSFFALYSHLMQTVIAEKDEESLKKLEKIQNLLFEKTEVGKQLQQSSKEAQTAIKALQEASKDGGLTREKLLDVVINAQSDIALSTIVSLARNGLDYAFFQLLTQKIEQARGKEKEKLITLRENLLELIDELDKRMQTELKNTRELLEKIVNAENIEAETERNLENISDLFLQIVEDEIDKARKNGDLERIQKLERVMIVIRKAMEPPKEVKLIEEMLSLVDKPEDLDKYIETHQDSLTPEFMQILNGIVTQESNQKDENFQKIDRLYQAILRYSMKKNLTLK